MTPAFTSKWLAWEPHQTPTHQTDKTDKRAFVSSVSVTDGHVDPKNGVAGDDSSSREAAINHWLNSHPPERADQDRCAACGGWLIGDFVPLVLRDKTGRPVWVHSGGLHGDECLRAFWKMRRAEAERALDAAGVRRPKREKA